MNENIQPIFVLPEGSMRDSGRSAQKSNIAAAKAVSDAVKATLGPKGMDKMISNASGEVIITNDGVTILEEMDIQHPAARMIVEVAKVQESEVGDGTTTAVILAGELLHNSVDLLDKNIHPTIIADGYKMAAKKAEEVLAKLGETLNIKDRKMLINIASTAMTGKNVEWAKEQLAEIAVDAVQHVIDNKSLDTDNIKIEKKEGGGSADTSLIEGIVLSRERIHSDMPKLVKNAKIALLDAGLEAKETEIDAKITITDPSQLQAFIDQEEANLKKLVDALRKSGANAVFCEKGIDDLAQHFLAKSGIFAIRRVTQADMLKLSRATGGKIVSKITDISSRDLGFAGKIEEKRLGEENMTFVEACKNPKAVTIIVRGGTEHVVDEVERALTDAIGDLAAAIIEGKCVAGGGAVEIELARQIKIYGESLSGREQLAVRAFAETLEIIPRTLAENAGLDPIDMLTSLKAAHDKKKKWAGLDVFHGKVIDMWKAGVIEPLKIKTQAVQSASEAAIMVLRIDDVIIGAKKTT